MPPGQLDSTTAPVPLSLQFWDASSWELLDDSENGTARRTVAECRCWARLKIRCRLPVATAMGRMRVFGQAGEPPMGWL